MKKLIIITAMLGSFCAGWICRISIASIPPNSSVTRDVFVTNYVAGYSGDDIVRVISESSQIGYTMGFEDGRKLAAKTRPAPANNWNFKVSTNGIVIVTVKPDGEK